MVDSDPGWTILVPGDPGQLTGGYGYVREIVAGLRQQGQAVSLTGLPGQFPRADSVARGALEQALSALPDGATVVVDGLALGGCPEPAERHGPRLNLIALVHHPLADEAGLSDPEARHLFETECRALAAVGAVITTSGTTAEGLQRYGVPADRIAVVLPGVHQPGLPEVIRCAPDVPVRILCLAHLSARKGQHQLVEALARVGGNDWLCELAGSVERSPDYAAKVRLEINARGLTDRVFITGELSGQALEEAFRQADLFVLPSLYEGYGMVIDEALAYGVPVISSDGGALAVTAARPGCVTYPAGQVEPLVRLLEERLSNRAVLEQQQRDARLSAGQLRSWQHAATEFRKAVAARVTALHGAAGSHFDADWLALREPADHAARSTALVDSAVAWLKQRHRSPLVVADIGAGTGSNWRYLSRALAGGGLAPMQWHLFEQDAELLSDVSGAEVHIGRLEAHNLDHRLPRPLNLLTASALIDLVARDWLDAFADAAANRGAAVLVVLSYAGRFRLTPSHQADDDLRRWVNEHQHGNKGSGAACGPEASGILAEALADRGYAVQCQPSPWRLGARHRALQKALMTGWVDAARERVTAQAGNHGQSGEWLDQWLAQRLLEADQGRLTIEVEHTDLLGLPPS